MNFPKEATSKATVLLELVHLDICRPMPTTPMGNSWFSLLLIGDFSHMTWIFCLAKKSQAFSIFKGQKARVDKETEKALRANHGGEYTSNSFGAYYMKE